jgi:hypothetical protein
MALRLQGSCRCGAVRFELDSHAPHPYQLCYCTICRKTAGGGGFAITIMGQSADMTVTGREALGIYRAEICDDDGSNCKISTGERHFCTRCATALWMSHPEWPEWVYPFASALDSDLPVPPARVHMMLRYKASWVVPDTGPNDDRFDRFPKLSVESWHRQHGLWVD